MSLYVPYKCVIMSLIKKSLHLDYIIQQMLTNLKSCGIIIKKSNKEVPQGTRKKSFYY